MGCEACRPLGGGLGGWGHWNSGGQVLVPGTHGDHLSGSRDTSARGGDELEACVLARKDQPLCVDTQSPLSHLSMEGSAFQVLLLSGAQVATSAVWGWLGHMLCNFRRSSLSLIPEINLVFTLHPFTSHWGSHVSQVPRWDPRWWGMSGPVWEGLPRARVGRSRRGCGCRSSLASSSLLHGHPCVTYSEHVLDWSAQRCLWDAAGGEELTEGRREEPPERKALGGAETGTSGFSSPSAVFHETLHLSAAWFPPFWNGEVISLTKLLDSSPEIVAIEEPGGLQSIGSQRSGHDWSDFSSHTRLGV